MNWFETLAYPPSPSAGFFKNLCTAIMAPGYDFDKHPSAFNAWLSWRMLVDFVLGFDCMGIYLHCYLLYLSLFALFLVLALPSLPPASTIPPPSLCLSALSLALSSALLIPLFVQHHWMIAMLYEWVCMVCFGCFYWSARAHGLFSLLRVLHQVLSNT